MNQPHNEIKQTSINIPSDYLDLNKLKEMLTQMNIPFKVLENSDFKETSNQENQKNQENHNSSNFDQNIMSDQNKEIDSWEQITSDELEDLDDHDLDRDLDHDLDHDCLIKNPNDKIEPQTLIHNISKDIELDLASDSDDDLNGSDIDQDEKTNIPNSNISNSKINENIQNTESPNINDSFIKIGEHLNNLQNMHNVNPPKQNMHQFNYIPNQYIKSNNKIIDDKNEKIEILGLEKKLILNIGGKKFSLKKKILEHLNINYNRLHKINKDGQIIYFLDKDPIYFSKIIEIIKIYGLNQDKILGKIDEYSDQLIGEMCSYGIIDKKYLPRPKLKLKRVVGFTSRHDDIIKIIIGRQLFETSSSTLSRSTYFDNKLKMSRSKYFALKDINAKIFRYVLNLLRIGELYVSSKEIIELLKNYGIEYEKLEEKKINQNIVSYHVPHNGEAQYYQMKENFDIFDPRNYPMINNDGYYHFANTEIYYPSTNLTASYNVENINVITTKSKLEFDSEIIFDLTDPNSFFGELIEDLLLCIDLPILKPTDQLEYVDFVEYLLIENIVVITNMMQHQRLMLSTSGEFLYFYPIIYTEKADDYHQMIKIDNKKMKVLYENNLIDIHRITIPLFLFKEKQNHLPIGKMVHNKMATQLIVKIAPIRKILKNKMKEIPLLNICLITNFVSLASNTLVYHDNKLNNIPTNLNLMEPVLYIYDKVHSLTVPIQTTSHPIYDLAIIPLNKMGLIKDFFFIISEKNDYISNRIDKFSDQLIEIEILYVKDSKTFVLNNKLDSTMMNYYTPLKKLGHKLPPGIYYHSFTIDPYKNQILGGLLGMNYFIKIKVKKMNGFIKFYANEYNMELF